MKKIVWVYLLFILGCKNQDTVFEALSSSETGIDFINQVTEDEKVNVLSYMNIYTGAGVAAGDVNNDGLTDLFFAGNQQSGRLYLNKGNLHFEDITPKAGLVSNRWQTGVSMVDINQDGWLDIYVNVSGNKDFGSTANLLYINNQDGTFSEKAQSYGIADERLTMASNFFDYDKDGDLDLFLITNPADEMVTGVNSLKPRKVNGESEGTDILYRNNGNNTFTDVSHQARILVEGYSLGSSISDVNADGWPDIYISNDFLTSDILYINNKNGTFTDRASEYLKHTSFASMGNDIADFNNDALADIFVLDMLPEDNYRKKMLIPSANFDKFQLSLEKGYLPAYTRNTLQLNNGNGSFSEIAFLSGVSSTDWSWSALWADYDNDGDKDLMVTNGFYRDLGNLDYINYQAAQLSPMGSAEYKLKTKLKAIHQLESVPLQDYVFENLGKNFAFQKRSDDWGIKEKGFSNGACYVDLDNDGDLEMVINRFNQKAQLYKNNISEKKKQHFIRLKFAGNKPNIQGIGNKVWLYQNGKVQFLELNPYRGYESSVEPLLHFGLGNNPKIDSLIVEWTDGNIQKIKTIKTDTTLTISYIKQNILRYDSKNNHSIIEFSDIARSLHLDYKHQENLFVDFKTQTLLPQMHSRSGPSIAVADVNGDRLDDFYVGAAKGSFGKLFIQKSDGHFVANSIPKNLESEDMGVAFFDADGDKDLDLYVVSGGGETPEGSLNHQDRLYINNGKGLFAISPKALPNTQSSGSCVSPCDFDHDGDIDLFVGGRIKAGEYPLAPKSYLLENKENLVFKDHSALTLSHIGMVSSALWVDINQDTWEDLVLVGEFMPLTIFYNHQGKLASQPFQVPHSMGCWNSLKVADMDGDGDLDFIAGNLGLNSRYKATEKEPLTIHGKDFDKNGLIDPVISHFVQGKEYIFHNRDELMIQIPAMKSRFDNFEKYAKASFQESFLKSELDDALTLKAECMESSFFENLGKGQFRRHSMPIEAQFAPIYGIEIEDLNNDGLLDVILAGNSYATEASTGRYDAMSGLVLLNQGRFTFQSLTSSQTHFEANQDVKALVKVQVASKNVYLVANNNSNLQAFAIKQKRNRPK